MNFTSSPYERMMKEVPARAAALTAVPGAAISRSAGAKSCVA